MRRVWSVCLLLPLALVLGPARPSEAKRPMPAAMASSKVTSTFGSMSMEVSNPTTAVASAERAIRKVGGTITHSSSNTDNGNLNASIPTSRLNAAMRAIRSIPGRVTNSNTSSSDLTFSMRNTKDRLADLELAAKELAKAMKNATDDDATRGLVILHELANNERRNLRSQLDSFTQQSKNAQFSISFSRPR